MTSMNDLSKIFLQTEFIPRLNTLDGFYLAFALGPDYVHDFCISYADDIIKNDFVKVGDILMEMLYLDCSTNHIPLDYHVNWVVVIRRTKCCLFVKRITHEKCLVDDTHMNTRPMFPVIVDDVCKTSNRLNAVKLRRCDVHIQKTKSFYTSITKTYKRYDINATSDPVVVEIKNTNFGM